MVRDITHSITPIETTITAQIRTCLADDIQCGTAEPGKSVNDLGVRSRLCNISGPHITKLKIKRWFSLILVFTVISCGGGNVPSKICR